MISKLLSSPRHEACARRIKYCTLMKRSTGARYLRSTGSACLKIEIFTLIYLKFICKFVHTRIKSRVLRAFCCSENVDAWRRDQISCLIQLLENLGFKQKFSQAHQDEKRFSTIFGEKLRALICKVKKKIFIFKVSAGT